MDTLPTFRFHPDPLGTGSVQPSDEECTVCGQVRGHIYVGPVYAEDEYEECICPWCIADGSAHKRLEAMFHDPDSIGGVGGRDWDRVPPASVDEIALRTPGFSGWQQERWWSHCGDAACFIGRAGHAELQRAGPTAIAAIREDAGRMSDEEWDWFFRALHKDMGPTAYLFRCLKCSAIGGYQDTD